MTNFKALAICACAALCVSGCKIVKDIPEDEQAIPADASGDDARTALRITETFQPQLLPFIADNALPIGQLRDALTADFEAASQAHGTPGSAAGSAWTFPVNGSGMVIETKLDTRARTAGLDTDGDGQTDVTVQLGPVIRGTALRDVAPFYQFDDFRDQIEFAKLSRALNDQVKARIQTPEGDFVGATLAFEGVVPLRKPDERYVITPVTVEISQ